MQLDKGERSLISYFPSSTKAQKAVDALKKAGYETVDMRRFGSNSVPDAEYNNPINRATSLAALTFYSAGSMDKDPGILLAADPAASGLSTGGELVGKRAFSVIVVTEESKVEQAVKIIEENGGEV